jgi:FKBP-type peptidyl-prolyl cis-trans isomerase FkpA
MLKKLSGYTLALVGLTLIFTSCKKDYESIQSVDSQKISDYIAKNNLTGMVADSAKTGYYYQIVTQGTGAFLKNTDSVLYNGEIKGMENGTVYSNSSNNGNGNLSTYVGYTSQLNGVTIPAIREVMLKMRRGGVARILLPSYLAYGKNGSGNIPSNENIDLTITTYPEVTQAERDDKLIQQFIASKGLNMIKDPSGVYYSIAAVGAGTYPITVNSTIETSYTGRLVDGTIFDANTDASLLLSGTIKGWSLTLPGKLQRDGKIRMLIPSGLAYGTSSQAGSTTYPNGIPSNAILDFDLQILSVLQ